MFRFLVGHSKHLYFVFGRATLLPIDPPSLPRQKPVLQANLFTDTVLMVSIQLEALFLGPSKWGLPTGPSSCRPSQTGSVNNSQRTAICSILSLPNKIQALFTTHSQILKPLSSKTLSRSSMLEHDNQAIWTSHTSSMCSDPYQNSLSLSIVTIPLALKHDGMQPWLLGCTFK